MTPKFLQLYYLIDHSGVLVNRDDNGSAKTLLKGGVIRTRWSSQSIKRKLRTATGRYALSNITPDAVRTKELASDLITRHIQQRLPEADGEAVETAVTALNIGLYGKDGNDSKKRQMLLFGYPEITWLSEAVTTCLRENPDPEEAGKAVAGLFNGSDAKRNFRAFRSNTAMPAGATGALHGRMVTADQHARIDGALHVAHAFTIHGQQRDLDFFTSMDDLRLAQQEAGSGYMGMTEISSGIFYLYMAVDMPLLVSNTTGHPAENWLQADRSTAAALAASVAALAADELPGAKLGSTAAHARAQVLLAEMGEDPPRSLAGAFTVPARPNIADGLKRLQEHLDEMDRMHQTSEARRLMAPGGDVSLRDVHDWIQEAVSKGAVQCQPSS